MNPASPMYNIGGYIKLLGKVNVVKLKEAIASSSRVFDAYKMRFDLDEPHFTGFLEEKSVELEIEEIDFSEYVSSELKARSWIQKRFNLAFEFGKDKCLFEHAILKISDTEYWFYGRYHHLITDGFGFSVFVQYVARKYKALLSNEAFDITYPLYLNKIRLSNEYYKSTKFEEDKNYWLDKIKEKSKLILPKKDVSLGKYEAQSGSIVFEIDASTKRKLSEVEQTTGVGIFHLTLASMLIYLAKICGSNEIILGLPVHKRGSKRLKNTLGMFSDILPFKGNYDGNIKVKDLLQEIVLSQKRDYRYQNYPSGELSRQLHLNPLEDHLYEVIVNYEPLKFEPDFGPDIKARIIRHANDHEDTPLSISWRDYGNEQPLELHIHFLHAYYSKKDINLLKKRLLFIIEQLGHGLENLTKEINILLPEELKLLKSLNNTKTDYPKDKTIVELFETQAAETPKAIAVVYQDKQINYKELNERSNQVAQYLQSRGVTTETLVPICIERSIEMIVGILGILKSGGAYVPIDPEYPQDRIDFMLEDTQAKLVLTDQASQSKLKSKNRELIDITKVLLNNLNSNNLRSNNLRSNNLAYVIYTSGSTGQPKGVMIEHRSVVNLIYTQTDYFDIDFKERILQFSNFSFDASVEQIFLAILNGAKLILFQEGSQLDPFSFKAFLKKQKITHLHATPGFLKSLENVDSIYLKRVIAGGDTCNWDLRDQWKEKLDFYNEYGPTETTVTVIEYLASHNKSQRMLSMPIGKPLSNTVVYIFDNFNQISPIGIAGEIYIGGIQVARGYLNRPKLTQEKFIRDPFSKDPTARLYKTGDLGRLLPDGNIEYIGRLDDQVKIRGYRIELGEIESVIEKSGLISHTVVLAKENTAGNKQLVGYVVAGPNSSIDKQAIQEFLKTRLPEYMVPQLWVELKSVPLNSNGKIDKNALPDPDFTELLIDQYVAPRNQTEVILAEIWKELLGLQKIGIHDNFFAIGGDSILTIQLSSRAARYGLSIKPKDIFMHRTIAGLSKTILFKTQAQSPVEQGILSGEVGLIPIQQWYLETTLEGISHYGQSVLLELDKKLSNDALFYCITLLGDHHDGLRLQYTPTSQGWLQQYSTNKLTLKEEDLSSLNGSEFKDTIHKLADAYQQSLEIETGDIARFVWIKTPSDQKNNRLLIIIHHLVVDGISWRILLQDMEIILQALKENKTLGLGQKTSSLREWYNALETYANKQEVKNQLSYWSSFANAYESIPTDTENLDESKLKDTINYTVSLGKDATQGLVQDVSKVYNTQINDLLLCSLAITISDWAKTNKVSIGMEGQEREVIANYIDTTRSIGKFTSLYPLLLELEPQTTIGNQIKNIKEQLRRLPDKGIGYGVLKYINKEESLQGRDPWDIVFNYLGQLDNVTSDSKWFKAAKESSGLSRSAVQNSREKLFINGSIQGGDLSLNWSCSGLLYTPQTLEKLATTYVVNLKKLIAHCLEQKQFGTLYTPSDYHLQDEIGYGELDRFLEEPFKGQSRRKQVQSIYRLSGLQQGMLFHSLYDARSTVYIEKFSFDLEDIVAEYMQKSWDYVIKNHTILRSAFYHEEFSIPIQVVYNNVVLPISWLDYRDMNRSKQQAAVKDYEQQDIAKGFDMKSPPLMRLTIIRLTEQQYRMVLTFHHILSDGWSMPILMEEILRAYDHLSKGELLPEKTEDRYEDYIRYLENKDAQKAKTYWKQYLDGLDHITQLPFISASAERNKGVGIYKDEHIVLNSKIKQKIRYYTQNHKITINTLMQGIWSYLLSCYSGSPDVAFGVTVSGRPDDLPEVEQRVGLYINTLPLYAKVQHNITIGSWLENLQQEQIASRNYQYSPLQDIQSWIGVQGDMFDTLLVFENYPVSDLIKSKQWSLEVTNINAQESTNYPLTIAITSAEQINIKFSFNSILIDETYIKAIRNQFEHVLLQVIDKPEDSWSAIDLLAPDERKVILGFNHTDPSIDLDKNVIDLFEAQTAIQPDAIAIEFESKTLTYRELSLRSNALAHYLIKKGVKQETLVALCMERRLEMIIALLGILKAGGAFVPIDPTYPLERIQFIVNDCDTNLILTSKTKYPDLKFSKGYEVILIEDFLENLALENTSLPEVFIPRDSLAYIIYTSGSTGIPKGAMIEHDSFSNYVQAHKKFYSITPDDFVIQQASISFDVSLEEIFPCLISGGTVGIVKDGGIDIATIIHYIEDFKATILTTTPMIVELLNQELKDIGRLRILIVSGDVLRTAFLDFFIGKLSIINGYGPTETAIGVSRNRFKDISEASSIGRPNPNNSIYILGTNNTLLPVGVSGEICIGGVQVGRGYLNRKELTAEKFISDPFSFHGKGRMYKTGDKGHWLSDGRIEFEGRLDNQVKIRGYRIELDEIESVLEQYAAISKSVILAKQNAQGIKFLAGYVVSHPNTVFDRQALITFLQNKLPEYMVPQIWVEIERIPLTSNGKIDKKALPDPDLSELQSNTYVAPRNSTESALVKIWHSLLNLKRIGVNDNFFELGGHSLLAMRAIAAIRKQLQIEPAIKDLFQHPTIAELASYLTSQSPGKLLPIIEKTESYPKHIPLSFSQERLWFIDRLEGSLQYHMPAVLNLQGKLNKKALELAFRKIVDRHEVLRTVIKEYEGQAFQQINSAEDWKINQTNQLKYHADPQGYIHQLISTPFDLSKDCMLRCHLIKHTNNEHLLLVTLHHIASDGWSISIMVREAVELYNASLEDRKAYLPKLDVQYADYSIWQRTYLQGEILANKLEYWKGKLEGLESLELPTDFSRPAIQSTKGAALHFSLDQLTTQSLNSLSRQQGATLFMTLLAAFKVLLYRYSGQIDICVGTPTAGRQQQEVENLIGFFINTLALRTQLDPDKDFIQFLDDVKTTTLAAYQHQDVPFEKVVEATVKQRDMSRSPLFGVMFVFQNTPEVPELKLGDMQLSTDTISNGTSKFDLTLNAIETPSGLDLIIEYCTDLFDEQTIISLQSHLISLLNSIINNPNQAIGSLAMMDLQEQTKILQDFNRPQADYPKDKTIVDLFEQQANKTPKATALVYQNEKISYQELNERSNQLSHYLQSKGVTTEALIPICIQRSIEMIVGILGILKSGAAYVPIDPGYPQDRIDYMLEDTEAKLVLTDSISQQKLKHKKIEWIDITKPLPNETPTNNLTLNNLTSSNLAYIIYTSGSTGRPKGVMVEHGSVVNLITEQTQYFRINDLDKILQFSNYSFDASVEQIFLALLNGATLVSFSEGDQLDQQLFSKILTDNKITHLHATPTFLSSLKNIQSSHLKRVVAGGDICSWSDRDQWPSTIEFFNEYGPTETTVTAIEYADEFNNSHRKRAMPIGRNLANTRVYILDNHLKLSPIGVAGEICIAGLGVARGYLNQPNLTKEKFIQDPFNNQSRLYRTGDLGRWLEDGNIEYLGRIDDQVKIRGYRIELGEIETTIQQSGLVKQSVVLAKQDQTGQKYLTGYLIPKGEYTKQALQNYLQTKLPNYMVPEVWVELDSIPLTANSKIDKKALPDPDSSHRQGEYVAPQTPSQQTLAEIWQELLSLERVGINDNFFELGGHSLLAMRVMSAIRKQLAVELSIKDLFQYPTIADLASYLAYKSRGGLLPELDNSQPRPKHIPLSFSQERLWFIDRLDGSVQYHMPAVLHLQGDLNKKALEFAFQKIIDRHEVLRTVIKEYDGQAYQQINSAVDWKINETDQALYQADPQDYIHQLISMPFDLSHDYMLRCNLIEQAPNEYRLVVNMHHIASDGWSISILVKELVELYNSSIEDRNAHLPKLDVQYADYSIWQRGYLQGEVLEKKLHYWKSKLTGVTPLALPTDYTDSVNSSKGSIVRFTMEKNQSDQLELISRQMHATLYMMLLSAFKVLLYRYTGQEDICVGSPIASRQPQESENLIGFFINTFAIRSSLNEHTEFTELLKQVKSSTIEAYEHQDVPFEKVVEAVVKDRDLSRNPLYDVFFNFQNLPKVPELRLGNMILVNEEIESTNVKFDISISLEQTNSGLSGAFIYKTELFAEQTIQAMVAHFKSILSSILQSPSAKISELRMLSDLEEVQLLKTFNQTNAEYPRDKSIVDLFVEQVEKTPHAKAVVYEDQQLTYHQLNQRANQLAHLIRKEYKQRTKKDLQPDTLIALFVDRNLEMVIGVLAILKAGGAYVPIDSTYPKARIDFILEDTNSELVLTKKHLIIEGNNPIDPDKIIYIDLYQKIYQEEEVTNLPVYSKPTDLAYVIYTSGTTGNPKGVMIEQRSVISKISYLIQNHGIDSTFVIGSKIPYTFDPSVREIFLALLSGAELVIISSEVNMDTDKLIIYCIDKKINLLIFVPSHLSLFISSLKKYNRKELALLDLKILYSCGEVLRSDLVNELQKYLPNLLIKNQYGPTEACLFSFEYQIPLDSKTPSSIPLGKLIDNTNAYVLSASKDLVPIGVIGELYIGGAGLARGYLNHSELTTERFLTNPFSSKSKIQNRDNRLYRTGDFVKWLANGNLEFIGRNDDQLKLRGYRIELSEIEIAIQQSGLISQAIVLALYDANNNMRLVGYFVSKQTKKTEKQELIGYLKKKLPEYMVPQIWVELEYIPLTSNGKIDRKALPEPDLSKLLSNSYIAPRNPIETVLVEIWQSLLNLERIGIHDNFFELGGHSLLAMRVIAAIRKQLAVELSIKDLFQHPKIVDLASHLNAQELGEFLPLIGNSQPRTKYIPLSFSQERLWFIDRLEGSLQYHMPAVLNLQGKLNKKALEFAFQKIIDRHEVLRTVIKEYDGQAYQQINSYGDWKIHETDQSLYQDDPQGYIHQLISAPFDLSSDYMLRCHLIKRAPNEHLIVVNIHHIASDGWSISILINEVVKLYNAAIEDRKANLPELEVQYADYSIWQRTYLQGEILANKLEYWKEKLEGLEPLELPTDFSRSAIQSTRGARLSFGIDHPTTQGLHRISQQQGVTLFMTLLAAFKVLLYRYTGQNDICVGTPTAGRQQQEVENLIGFFINTLALRTQLDPDKDFIQLLDDVKNTTLAAYQHQEVPFEKVVEAVVKQRDMSRSPLFGVMFVFQNTPEVPELKLGDMQLTTDSISNETSKFDLTLNVNETSNGLHLTFEYCTDLFDELTVIRLHSHLSTLLNSIITNPNQAIGRLPMMDLLEQTKILQDFNRTQTDYPKDKTIVDLFEQQAAKTPQAIAVIFEEEALTYQELNERSNQLAHYLQSKGVTTETLVPICIERSIEMIVGILGILKSGAAYVPIDPEYPQDRIDYMLEDTKAALVLTDQASQSKLKSKNRELVNLSKALPNTKQTNNLTLNILTSTNLAYIIYTSGSTGTPKGVMVEHGNVVSLAVGGDFVTLNQDAVLLSTGSSSFDATTIEYWGMLLNGGKLVLCSEEDLLNVETLKHEIKKQQVTLMWFTSGWFNKLVETDICIFEPLDTLMVGGEKLSEWHINSLLKTYPNKTILNGYGPTENTTFSLTYEITNQQTRTIPIGQSLANRSAYILDHEHKPVPIGVPGELYVGGDGVSRGYLNQSEITKERFIQDPFNKQGRLYKTGDLGRWLEDGNIEYLGRIDDQVKIRGYRIELGEIEATIQQSGLIKQSVVLAREDQQGTKRLVGYVVGAKNYAKEELETYLKTKLPEYMVPRIWVELEQLPLTANGKINKKALPDPDLSELLSHSYIAPRNETEEKLAESWQSILNIEKIGIHDNFFELGGHSLMALRIISAIRNVFNKEVEVIDFIENPTIAQLGMLIDTLEEIII